jgi:ActR/RegA family two-component response regulator
VSERISLLLVDDDAEFLGILHCRFTRRGLAATACGDPALASERARCSRGDHLPHAAHRRRHATAEAIETTDARPQVIILSGHAEAAMVAAN